MPLVAPRYTIADLDRFPDDGNRYELLHGALLVSPAPEGRHQSVLGQLTMALSVYLSREKLAYPTTPGVIQRGDETQFEPDLLVVPERYRNLDWSQVKEWWLAVEVSGAPSRARDRDLKRPVYLEVGVREVWRVDLNDRAVYVSRPDHPEEVQYDDRLHWHPKEMAEPLELDLGTIF